MYSQDVALRWSQGLTWILEQYLCYKLDDYICKCEVKNFHFQKFICGVMVGFFPLQSLCFSNFRGKYFFWAHSSKPCSPWILPPLLPSAEITVGTSVFHNYMAAYGARDEDWACLLLSRLRIIPHLPLFMWTFIVSFFLIVSTVFFLTLCKGLIQEWKPNL